MNAVIYARYSCDHQREESIEGQIRECTAFAEQNGMTVLRCYCDRAYSAKTDNRLQFPEMIRDAEKQLFDTIIVRKRDRFAHNRYDSAHCKYQLKENGVRVILATETISESADGILPETALEGIAGDSSAGSEEKVNKTKRMYSFLIFFLFYRADGLTVLCSGDKLFLSN